MQYWKPQPVWLLPLPEHVCQCRNCLLASTWCNMTAFGKSFPDIWRQTWLQSDGKLWMKCFHFLTYKTIWRKFNEKTILNLKFLTKIYVLRSSEPKKWFNKNLCCRCGPNTSAKPTSCFVKTFTNRVACTLDQNSCKKIYFEIFGK